MLRFSAKAIIIIIQSIWVASISSSMLPPIEKLQTIQNLIKCTDFKFQFENNTIFKEFLVHKSFMCLDVIKRIYTIANRGDSSAFIKAKIMFNASRINHKISLPAGVGQFSNFLSLLKGTAFIPPFLLSSHSHFNSVHLSYVVQFTLWHCTRNWLYFDHKTKRVCIPLIHLSRFALRLRFYWMKMHISFV